MRIEPVAFRIVVSLCFAAVLPSGSESQERPCGTGSNYTFLGGCQHFPPGPPECYNEECVWCCCNNENQLFRYVAPNGGACNADDNPCTNRDECQDGVCVSGPGCERENDSAYPCWIHYCPNNGYQGCQFKPAPAETPCDNGIFCDGPDECKQGGSCGPIDAEEGDPCPINYCEGTCDGFLDQCRPPPDCSVIGEYQGVPEPNACTRDWCDGQCQHELLDCDDENACNGTEGCNQETGCYSGTPLECDDEDACTDDSCEAAGGCQNVNNIRSCDDDDACTENDECQDGDCVGTPKVCNDGTVCTTDSCDQQTGCQFVPVTCNDNIPCTIDYCHYEDGCQHGCFESAAPNDLVPKKDDHTFVYKGDHHLVSGVYTFDNHLKVTRYAGPLDGWNHLEHAAELYARNLADPSGILRIYAYGVSGAQHAVSFNGTHRGYLKPSPTCEWSTSVFSIPLDQIRFPARGPLGPPPLFVPTGAPPTPQANTITITVSGQPECLRFRGASLSVKLMSPIILIHGTNNDPEFFLRQGFVALNENYVVGLDNQYLLYDRSIKLTTNPRNANAIDLDTKIPPIVASFGVDSIHVVAHSKGGLDTREYLEIFQRRHDSNFKVLSFTTLSTPHNGSVLADLVVARRQTASHAIAFEFPGFPAMTGLLADLNALAESVFGTDLGVKSLTTEDCGRFNMDNLLPGALPSDIIYNTVSADADCNGNARIDASELDEWWDLTNMTALVGLKQIEASRR